MPRCEHCSGPADWDCCQECGDVTCTNERCVGANSPHYDAYYIIKYGYRKQVDWDALWARMAAYDAELATSAASATRQQ